MNTLKRSLLAGFLTTIAIGAACASAGAATPIEGIWSFNGGEVAVQPSGSGEYTGTVVVATKFSQCYHPVGQVMWTTMRQQSDGSYWGDHQWYFATEQCLVNPTPGLAAWRVLTANDGSRVLRFCTSEPGSSAQPTISADGSAANYTYGCQDSARISALPGDAAIALPDAGGCVPARRMRIRLREAKGDPFESVSVVLRSGSVKRTAKLNKRSDGVVAVLDLRRLPQEQFTVRVKLTTVLGKTTKRKRVYNVCHLPRRKKRSS